MALGSADAVIALQMAVSREHNDDRLTVSVLTCHDELVEAHGKIDAKSLCTSLVLKCGV